MPYRVGGSPLTGGRKGRPYMFFEHFTVLKDCNS